ncbi:MAG: ADP-ribosylglycohydrolase family protein [Treponema sp.]|nr:ADP-ribosylglycohydrolase family protein [Treponema sp.]
MSDSESRALILGLATGDALGCPVQFYKREQVKSFKITGMVGHGTYNLEAGAWTDDTSMSLALADSLIQNKEINYEDIMTRFQNWLLKNEYTPFGKAFDMGQTCMQAIIKYKNGIPALDCGGIKFRENGNGSLMRIAPIILYLRKNFGKEGFSGDDAHIPFSIVENISKLTHGHYISLIACDIYVLLLNEVLNGCNKSNLIKETFPKIREYITYKNMEATKNKDIEHSAVYEKAFRSFNRIFDPNFINLPEEEISSTGYVLDSLEAALWCFFNTDSYRDCLIKVINLGGDTDSIGAIAGALSALYYLKNPSQSEDKSYIPEEWISFLQNMPLLERIIKGLEEKFSDDGQK